MLLDLFSTMRVVALPTKTNFRGINIREVALFRGEYGWGEFSPFFRVNFCAVFKSIPGRHDPKNSF